MRILCIVLLAVQAGITFGQGSDKVLFSIDGDQVYSSEFLRVYEKNRDIVIEEENKGFEDYFQLFLEFKLKLKEARNLQLDTLTSYLDDLTRYREQLVQPYLQNPEALEELTREAYERSLYEIEASHILIRCDADALASDTLKASQRIAEARSEILNGTDFEQVARKYSEDPSVVQNGGNLGFFGAFAMVYPFETVAYQTPVGSLSDPFRTAFGYHLIQVHQKRRSPGEVEVSHIMARKDSLQPLESKQRIDDIYRSLEQGDDFSKIAQEHSDDLSSAKKGGRLPRFGTGRMIQPFEEVAFSLEEEGDFSEPFETQYGWHILKLDKRIPLPPYEELKPKLEARVKSGSRMGYVESSLAAKVGADYRIQSYLEPVLTASDLSEMSGVKDTVLTLEGRVLTGDDFYRFAQKDKGKDRRQLFEDFKNKEIIDYYKDHLEQTNAEFAATFGEYRDGLLLFELLQREIWDRSEQDSVRVEEFFKANRDRYTWNKRADLAIGSCTQKEKAETVRGLLIHGKSTENIKEMMNEGPTIHVLFSQGKLEEGSAKLPEGFVFAEGVSDIYEQGDNQFTIIRVDRIYPATRKELDEARGEVLNDYQNHLEETWVNDLKAKYTVRVNKKNYRALKMEIESR